MDTTPPYDGGGLLDLESGAILIRSLQAPTDLTCRVGDHVDILSWESQASGVPFQRESPPRKRAKGDYRSEGHEQSWAACVLWSVTLCCCVSAGADMISLTLLLFASAAPLSG
jgi:hypothetical protein